MLKNVLKKIDENIELTRDDIHFLLSLSDKKDMQALYDKAYEVKMREVGDKVYYRGIIEFSNICEKNCYYCGIRKDNKNTERFQMTEDEIVEAGKWIYENNYGSVVLQSGERTDAQFVDFIERILTRIKKESDGKLGITICLGEQSEETFQRWYDAGAHRYLLRIESTNPEIYKRIHPEDHDFEKRRECIKTLQKIGYQTGTGVMIGLPGQTIDDLVNDILFYKQVDIDMIGMGPYIVHNETPLAKDVVVDDQFNERQLDMGLKMIAVARIFLKDVNIASTTALQALHPTGREMGLKAGANVLMPNVTATKYRSSYQLYDGKPCLDENSGQCRFCLERRIGNIGETIAYNEWGDSKHYFKRTGQ